MEKNPRHRPLSVRAAAAVFCLLLPALLGACGKPANTGGKLSDADTKVMGEYEQVRAALAADDLRTAKKAAATMVETLKPLAAGAPASPMLQSADTLTNATALDRARQDFKTMSAEAIHLTSGVSGYYVINCPMTTNGDWVQTNTTVDNPYMGKIMHDCGAVKK